MENKNKEKVFKSLSTLSESQQKEFKESFNSLTNTNFGIAKMSSLADEMLVLNKPIIIYEKDDPSFVYDYGTEILSQSFTDLENKVFRIKKDIENYNKSLGVIREKFYTKFDEKKINSELDKINSINE